MKRLLKRALAGGLSRTMLAAVAGAGLAAASLPVDRPVVGIIGGSGLLNLAGLEDVHRKVARTPWGQTSGALSFGRLAGVPVVFLARHGYGHTIAPHQLPGQRLGAARGRREGLDRLLGGGGHP